MTSVPADDAQEHLAVDTYDDADSAVYTAPTAGLTSLRSSVLRFQEENGRTYHSLSSGKYYLPNDESENVRLDITHNMWLLSLRGELGLAPKAREGAKRVLDAGTGNGVWAIDFADLHPEAEVIGVDLSPIQPSLVPPNCMFEIDDLEKEWTWTQPFDYILSRSNAGCFQDPQDFVRQAYAGLEPGGYLELQDFCLPYTSDDGTLTPDHPIHRSSSLSVKAAKLAGRPIDLAPQYKTYLENAGFVDVVERRLKWPLNEWPKDPHYKELGSWVRECHDQGSEGMIMALFTRYLGWTKEEVMVLCAQIRARLKDRSVHGYIPLYVVYGRKPGVPPGTEADDVAAHANDAAPENKTAP